MTDKELKDLVASLAIESKKTDEQIKILRLSQNQTDEQIKILRLSQNQTDEQMKKTDIKLDKLLSSHKKLGKMLGGISNSQGDVAEEFFINSIGSNQNIGGIQYDFMDNNISRKRNNIQDEFDIVLVNGKDVAIIEIKYKLHQKDIDRLLNKKLVNFKKIYPEYKDYNHHLGLASFKIYDDLKQEALDNNIMVLQRKGDVIESFLP
jgi:hypothetical protein